ncbi:MAG: hypothetical protein JSV58_07135 [Candidatus Bathyarchaeota archaeon]|nr:MAG: hypothetical protein JSV58_07135 [Candidatus Bathyarchaeota archaeon]
MRRVRSLPGLASLLLLVTGVLALICSVIFTSSVLAFIGLGLTFWGVLLLYLTRERYVRSKLFDSTVQPSLEVLCEVVSNLDYRGKAVYLPPRYLKDFKSGIVYIPKQQDAKMPIVGEVSTEKAFSKNENGLSLTPSGLNLANLYEQELGIDFVRVDLKRLQNDLPGLLIENLEIARDVEIHVKGSLVTARFLNSIYEGFCQGTSKRSGFCTTIGCPLCSSIACVLSRTTGKPIVVEKNKCSETDGVIEVQYRILED